MRQQGAPAPRAEVVVARATAPERRVLGEGRGSGRLGGQGRADGHRVHRPQVRRRQPRALVGPRDGLVAQLVVVVPALADTIVAAVVGPVMPAVVAVARAFGAVRLAVRGEPDARGLGENGHTVDGERHRRAHALRIVHRAPRPRRRVAGRGVAKRAASPHRGVAAGGRQEKRRAKTRTAAAAPRPSPADGRAELLGQRQPCARVPEGCAAPERGAQLRAAEPVERRGRRGSAHAARGAQRGRRRRRLATTANPIREVHLAAQHVRHRSGRAGAQAFGGGRVGITRAGVDLVDEPDSGRGQIAVPVHGPARGRRLGRDRPRVAHAVHVADGEPRAVADVPVDAPRRVGGAPHPPVALLEARGAVGLAVAPVQAVGPPRAGRLHHHRHWQPCATGRTGHGGRVGRVGRLRAGWRHGGVGPPAGAAGGALKLSAREGRR
eukprot:scaffold29915_cov90-Isochrysis_galbana.AAC.3